MRHKPLQIFQNTQKPKTNEKKIPVVSKSQFMNIFFSKIPCIGGGTQLQSFSYFSKKKKTFFSSIRKENI